MHTLRHRSFPALAAVGALALSCLAACSQTDLRNSCTSDSECKSASATKCIRGRCGCESNAQCDLDQFCNADGSCQARVGCQNSLDCPKGEFCDTTTGNCIGQAHCTKDVQCDLGKICDRQSFTCTPGCNEAGDCPLGNICQCPDGSNGSAGMPCASKGQCINGPCADDTYCQYGQNCVVDPSGGPNRCVTDTRGPFCGQCDVSPGQLSYCGDTPRNYCLVDTTKGFAASFCGVDCSEGQKCPFGFECSDVLILTSATCGSGFAGCPLLPKSVCAVDADCNGMGSCVAGHCTCSSDAECPAGECDTTKGQCHGKCTINEGSVQGFCTCMRNEDCPSDRCGADRHCSITGKDCDPNNPGSCGQIFCKKVMDPLSKELFGYCFIGQNCAPENGVTCDQVTSQN